MSDDDDDVVGLLRRLGFRVTAGSAQSAGLAGDIPVARVVPGADGFDVLDGARSLGHAADEAGAVEVAQAAVAGAGGGHVHVYDPLHQIRRVVEVHPTSAPAVDHLDVEAPKTIDADQAAAWQAALARLRDNAPSPEQRAKAATVLAAAPAAHSPSATEQWWDEHREVVWELVKEGLRSGAQWLRSAARVIGH